MKGVILDVDSLGINDINLDPIMQLPIGWAIYGTSRLESVAERVSEANILLTNKVPISETMLSAAPKLCYIGVLATGTDVIDVATANDRGVVVTNVTGYGTAYLGFNFGSDHKIARL